MEFEIEKSWEINLKEELGKKYFLDLKEFLERERNSHIIYPSDNLVFQAFNKTPFDSVKVVILGQDPYHGEGQAHGLSFSVPDGVKFPPSLRNIYKELTSDVSIEVPFNGNLTNWANQGVLLLNATLTVRKGEAGSHQKKGWEIFTNECIKLISDKNEGVVFLLWGNYAKQKEVLIDAKKHFVLKSVHPSPFSARNGFFGCKHFSKTNEILVSQNKPPIDWSL